ncbi:MAG: relaxase [Syntrophomonadaceae bacterium]|nr:relaxase [Syntrophomonadaceae bacterium]
MSKSVVICNIIYCQPGSAGKGKTHSSHSGHLYYIATRPGADRGDADALRVGDDDRAGHGEHAAYITDRPGSTGLFGHPDLGTGAGGGPEWQDVAQELDGHTLPVWRVVVSLREDDAQHLGMTSRAEWEAAMRHAAHSAIKAMHLDPDKARWAGAYHQAQGHPHAHIVIWERPHEAARRDGHLEKGEIKGVWRSYAGELFRSERERLTAEKTAMRDLVRDMAKGDISRLTGMDKAMLEVQVLDGGRPGLPPALQPDQEQELMRRLEALARIMPTRGRVALAYMPPEVKAEARAVADWLLTQPRFAQTAERHDAAAVEIAGHYSRKPAALEQARQNARDDIRDRVAQVVLRGAAVMNREERNRGRLSLAKARIARSVWQSAWRGLERDKAKMEAKAKLTAMREEERAKAKARREAGLERY